MSAPSASTSRPRKRTRAQCKLASVPVPQGGASCGPPKAVPLAKAPEHRHRLHTVVLAYHCVDVLALDDPNREEDTVHVRVCLDCYEYLVHQKTAGTEPDIYVADNLTGYDPVFQKTSLRGSALEKLHCDICDKYLFIATGDPCTAVLDPITESD